MVQGVNLHVMDLRKFKRLLNKVEDFYQVLPSITFSCSYSGLLSACERANLSIFQSGHLDLKFLIKNLIVLYFHSISEYV